MTKKIAILTFFKSGNFGGELQAYALQKVLRESGYNVEVLHQLRPNNKEFIDTGNYKPIYSPQDKKTKSSRIKGKIVANVTKIYNGLFGKNARVRAKRFDEFERTHINLTPKVFYSFDDLYNSNLDYDIYVVGSDQVWNFEYIFSPEPYFLTFAQSGAKRVSYAASIGHSELPEEIKPFYKKWIDQFDSISLREQQGVDIVKSISDKEAITVLDPTLLIKKAEWVKYLGVDNLDKNEKYLLIYTLVESKYVFEKAFEIAKHLNLKIKRVVPRSWTREVYSNVENIFDAGPIEFIELFANASFVLTNSFHGTAFSVNFNIPFYSIPKKTKKTNSRFINLLKLVGLSDRIVYDGENRDVLNSIEVDFSKANQKLDEERVKSLEFLYKSIN
ncbi:polysaccharide pyruvyl transferase family protein [Myroides phaeus]|uniref:polysaccharide pyruvyl transferase family protein n=1 Tax=Myroides phaeus TaxID=702745 RepID=UPI0013032B66|nr:polysaccharide pyruvyl transferase family protein [Myroides phaeus]